MPIDFAIAIMGVAIGFRFVNKAASYLLRGSKLSFHLSYVLPILEFLAWSTLFILVVKWVAEHPNSNISIALGTIFLFVMVPLFYYVREFLIGISLKIRFHLLPGLILVQDTSKREIVKTGAFSITLKNRNNQITTVAYSKINPEWIPQPGGHPHLMRRLLMFQVPSSGNIERQKSKLLQLISDSPWHVASMAPAIENTIRHNGTLKIQVVVYVLRHKDAKKIKTMIGSVIQKSSLN